MLAPRTLSNYRQPYRSATGIHPSYAALQGVVNMACGGISGAGQRRLTAVSTTQTIEWFTEWLSCVGLDWAMPILVARAATSQYFEAQLVVQVAKVRTDAPEVPVLKGSVQTPTNGNIDYNPGLLDLTSDTVGAMFVRFGVAFKYATGQAPAAADVEVPVAFARCGELVASGSWQLDSATTSLQYLVISGWVPRILVDQVKLAAICSGLTGNLQWRLAYRTAATQKALPSTWTNVTDANAPYTGGEKNTGDLAVSLGSTMWVQFAIAYNLSSSGAGQGSLTAALGVRRD